MSEMDPWKIMSHVVAYRGRFQVIEDLAQTPRGEIRYTFIHSPALVVATLAFTRENKVMLIREYRHPLKRVIFDLPGGSAKPGESAEEAARRELEEETGIIAGTMQELGQLIAYPNAIDMGVQLFMTREERRVPRHPNQFEFGETVEIEWDTLLNEVRAGEYDDAALQLAVLLAAARVPVAT